MVKSILTILTLAVLVLFVQVPTAKADGVSIGITFGGSGYWTETGGYWRNETVVEYRQVYQPPYLIGYDISGRPIYSPGQYTLQPFYTTRRVWVPGTRIWIQTGPRVYPRIHFGTPHHYRHYR